MRGPENIGLSRLAQVSLASTALAPVLLVWAAATYESHPFEAVAAASSCIMLVVLGKAILALAVRELQSEPVGIVKATRMDRESLAFLVTYALPLIAQSEDHTNFAALLVFAFVVALVLVQLQIFHVNPLLGILGYHFYELEVSNGDMALAISKSRHLPDANAQGQRLGPALWLVTTSSQVKPK
jgi:hypothetical protein